MKPPKQLGDVTSVEQDLRDPSLIYEKGGNTADQEDMYRMGKVQATRRNFNGFTIFGFSMVLLSTWEAELGVAVFGLLNGGTAGLIWMYLIVMIGFGFVIASLAEIASMAPTAGGQYHWVSEFSPRSIQKPFSYVVGWLLVLGWQVGPAATAFINGTVIQGLIVLNNPDYVPQRWHGTLLAFVVIAFSILFNTLLSRHLPILEGIMLVLHIIGFFAIAIPLWVMGPHGDAHAVFTEFGDNAGWGSLGTACLVGMIGAINGFVGSDAAAHMSEEVRDASHVLPRAMMWSWLGNGLFGWAMLITFCFSVGDVESVLATPTGYPYIQVFYNSTGSKAGTTVMVSIILIISTVAGAALVAACSRQLFAFARDKGVPFSSFFATINPRFEVPLNAVVLTTLISMILALINIGSTTAFNQIISLGVGAMMSSYVLSILCIFLRRIRGQALLPSKFNLGRAGIWINGTSIAFLAASFVMTFFPPAPNPTPQDANWSVLIYSGVVIFSIIYYIFKGRHEYDGPVAYVRRSA